MLKVLDAEKKVELIYGDAGELTKERFTLYIWCHLDMLL